MIIGVDEAGRGPLAGPVVAAAVLLCKPRPSGLDDSKKLTAARRAELEATIKRRCQWAVSVVEVEDIDRLNIFGATMLAMTLAVDALCAQLGCDPLASRPTPRMALDCSGNCWRGCDRTVHFGCIHYRQRASRPDDVCSRATAYALWLGKEQRLRNARPSRRTSAAWAIAVAPEKLRAGVPIAFVMSFLWAVSPSGNTTRD